MESIALVNSPGGKLGARDEIDGDNAVQVWIELSDDVLALIHSPAIDLHLIEPEFDRVEPLLHLELGNDRHGALGQFHGAVGPVEVLERQLQPVGRTVIQQG